MANTYMEWNTHISRIHTSSGIHTRNRTERNTYGTGHTNGEKHSRNRIHSHKEMYICGGDTNGKGDTEDIGR